MHYLFGFSGRMNRAKMWLFILVTLAWEMVIGMVAAFGLSWTHYITRIDSQMHDDVVVIFPWPDPVVGQGWVAVGIIGVLIFLYFIALLAVYTKRLHDRNKSALWLIPFVFIPTGLGILQVGAIPALWEMGSYFGPLGMRWGAAHLIGTILTVWAIVELFFFRGTVGPNHYGSDPLAR